MLIDTDLVCVLWKINCIDVAVLSLLRNCRHLWCWPFGGASQSSSLSLQQIKQPCVLFSQNSLSLLNLRNFFLPKMLTHSFS